MAKAADAESPGNTAGRRRHVVIDLKATETGFIMLKSEGEALTLGRAQVWEARPLARQRIDVMQ